MPFTLPSVSVVIVGFGSSTVMESALQEALYRAEKQALKRKEKFVGRKRNGRVGKDNLFGGEAIAV